MAGVDYRQGDYRVVADRLRPAAQHLVDWIGDELGDLVVDVAAGTGNAALLCSARGITTVAVDRVPELLALGRSGSDPVHWVAGDAHAMPLRDGVASAALSTFGLIYASRPQQAVAELARVTRPGGVLGLTTWPSGSFQSDTGQVLAEFVDLRAAGHDHIAAWGDAEAIAGQLAPVAGDVDVAHGDLQSTHPSLDAWWEQRAHAAPPIVTAKQTLDAEGFAELGRRMCEVAQRYGEQTADGFVLRDRYLVARARTRA